MYTQDDQAEDQAYYQRRALEEQMKALTCEDNAAAKAHLDMAAEYRRRAQQLARMAGG